MILIQNDQFSFKNSFHLKDTRMHFCNRLDAVNGKNLIDQFYLRGTVANFKDIVEFNLMRVYRKQFC